MYNQNENFMDAVNIAGFILGIVNVLQNAEALSQNDILDMNQQQSKFILSELEKRFSEQNEILEKQNDMLKRILDLLEGQ